MKGHREKGKDCSAVDGATRAMVEEERRVIAQLPLRSGIFLPTEAVPPAQRVAGLRRVKEIYEERWAQVYAPRLRALREAYHGFERCFVIGNGPSLNRTDLMRLRGEVTFGLNGIFLKLEEMGFNPTFYVVEDHLVAEDRAEQINALKGPTKLFPIYLAYCLEEGSDTIFFNHRPRKSYPHGFDFSTDAGEVTYAGCTVTFTCLQLAYYLGFRRIYLVGVDASYQLPKTVQKSGDYGVSILNLSEDDPNHFHPDYFGKGYRWHDPQVDKMLEAYAEARRVTEANGVRILNATVGGALEVFERVDYDGLFMDEPAVTALPRVLVLDMTRIGSASATGQLKQNLFAGWPAGYLAQVSVQGHRRYMFSGPGIDGLYAVMPKDFDALLERVRAFAPDVIYCRPQYLHWDFHHFAERVIDTLGVPVVTHLMDDWPQRVAHRDSKAFPQVDAALRRLLRRSVACLSIGEAMSRAFQERYGVAFTAVANGVKPEQWQALDALRPRRGTDDPFVLRYVGALAEDMTLASVVEVARAVDALHDELDLRFEVYTMPLWKPKAGALLQGLRGVSVHVANHSEEEYRRLLVSCHGLVIAYNFDEDSMCYVRYSMANKLPECLASGVPVLAYGPPEVATIAHVAEQGIAQVVTEQDPARLREAIAALVRESERAQALAKRARACAFTHHRADRMRGRLQEVLREAARCHDWSRLRRPLTADNPAVVGAHGRDEHVHLNETVLVAALLDELPPEPVMFDVGAHHGSALAPFLQQGWRVFAFEPDAANRKKLKARVGKSENVIIDPRAVGEKEEAAKPFFTSKQSTGISGLSAFHETHTQSGVVDVTTVAEIVEQHGLARIDFLKIDVEGLDFSVLKGIPWERIRPGVIECEFEDAKTVPLGHSWRDMAEFLVNKGYTVYVSEWHPIIRYGIRHDWFGMKRYPCMLEDEKAWGNLLAFLDDPGPEAIKSALKKCLSVNTPVAATHEVPAAEKSVQGTTTSMNPEHSSAAAHEADETLKAEIGRAVEIAAAGDKALRGELEKTAPQVQFAVQTSILTRLRRWARMRYFKLATAIKARSLVLFRLGQVVAWSLRAVRRRPLVSIGLLTVVVVLATLPAHPQLWPYRFWLWGTAGLAGLVGLGVALIAVANEALRRLLASTRSVHQANAQRIAKLEKHVAALKAELEKTAAAGDKALRGELEKTAAAAREADEALKAEIGRAVETAAAGDKALRVVDSETKRLHRCLSRMAGSNAALYQRFNRAMDEDAIKRVVEYWAIRLSLPVDRRAVGYLAHRIGVLEETCVGRLATSTEAAVLRVLVARSIAGRKLSVLEIGTLFGVGAGAIYDLCRPYFTAVHLTVIDPFEGYYGADALDPLTGMRVTEAQFRNNMVRLRIPDEDVKIIPTYSESDQARRAIRNRRYHVLIIDGDHSGEGVRRDFENYRARVAPGGYIIFDDYGNPDWPEIKPIVDELVMPRSDLEFLAADWNTAVFRVLV